MDQRPIGIFDSGLGGLTAIPYLERLLPHERLIYFGDTARTPYGSKAVRTIRTFAREIVSFLCEEDVKLVAIACNTVSSTCLDDLRACFPHVQIVGIIEPMVEQLVREAKAGERYGVIATKVTIESDVYAKEIERRAPELPFVQKACPIFVPLIEEGLAHHPMMDLAIRHYLGDWVEEEKLTDLVLGCTHYPYIAERILAIYPKLRLHNPSRSLAEAVKQSLSERDLLAAPQQQMPEHRFYASDLSDNFRSLIDALLERPGAQVLFRNLEA